MCQFLTGFDKEAMTNPSHTSKLWCMIFIEMASVSIVYSRHCEYLYEKIYGLVGFAYGLILFHIKSLAQWQTSLMLRK